MRSHVLAFDNLGTITSAQSDVLCRICTGGAFGTRQLFSDDGEMLFEACRPIVANAIDSFVTKVDLADRTVSITLRRIDACERKPLAEVKAAFEHDRPAILGALLDAMVHGLRHESTMRPSKLPRMADFASWAIACEQALWPAGAFMAAFEQSQRAALDELVDRSPVVQALVSLLIERREWRGTMTELFNLLSRRVDDSSRESRSFPADPAYLGQQLRNKLRPVLRERGVEMTDEREGHKRERIVTLRLIESEDASRLEDGTSK